MKILELFCGTKSISKVFEERGHETFTVDFDPQHNPDLCVNILDFDINDLPKEFKKPDVIWASPPCNAFSVLTIGRYWSRPNRPKHYRAFIGMAQVMRTIQIIETLKPKYWFIENPRGMLRKTYFMDNLPRKTVTYCQYGKEWRKPTDIWTNATEWIPKCCKAYNNCHEKISRGENKGVQGGVDLSKEYNWDGSGSVKRAVIPEQLCAEIVNICEGKLILKQKGLLSH